MGGGGGRSVDHLSVCLRAALTLAAPVSFGLVVRCSGRGSSRPRADTGRKISNRLSLSQNDISQNNISRTSNIRLYAGDRSCYRKNMRPSHHVDGSHRLPRLCLASHRLLLGCHQFVSGPWAPAVVFRRWEMVGKGEGREAVALRRAAVSAWRAAARRQAWRGWRLGRMG